MMNAKMTYERTEIETIRLEERDVITTSTPETTSPVVNLPIIPL